MVKLNYGKTLLAFAVGGCFILSYCVSQEPVKPIESDQAQVAQPAATPVSQDDDFTQTAAKNKTVESKISPSPITPFIASGIDWLIKAQHEDGGWGGGSHAAQNVRDPQAVPSDPATTAFTTLALVRAGSTPSSGEHSKVIRKALNYLCETVEKASDEGPRITDIQGTQPQQKLGGLVDTTMTTQCLARVIKEMNKDDDLYVRVDKALDKCISKLEKSQKDDGSWNVAGGWAPVLQSSSGQTALEFAQVAGKKVSPDALSKAIQYQTKNVDVSGRAASGAMGAGVGGGVSAGVELYSFSSGQRGNAAQARFANEAIEMAKAEGRIEKDAEVTEASLQAAGLDKKDAKELNDAFVRNFNQIERLDDEKLLKGFGNNGGEEFVSFLLTSESMIIAGGEDWTKWNDKMHGMLKKIQNQDGSWSGHHCITNPTFCTAAVIQCLLADHDADLLIEIAEQTKQAERSDGVSNAGNAPGESKAKTETRAPAETKTKRAGSKK